jgi:hypothetical protein
MIMTAIARPTSPTRLMTNAFLAAAAAFFSAAAAFLLSLLVEDAELLEAAEFFFVVLFMPFFIPRSFIRAANCAGVGPALAGRMIDWRTANGGFKAKEDLLNVAGIGDKLFASVKDLVTL